VVQRWPWPLPALLAWAAAWGSFHAARAVGLSPTAMLLLATTTGVVFSLLGSSLPRKLIMALGFPLSWVLLWGGSLDASLAWAWLLPLGLFLALYPPGSWQDAPLFPTPPEVLNGLREAAPLPLAGHVLDAGCGLGDGLIALEREYPDVHLVGIERSLPLRLLCALRCRWARVLGGDMWAADWSPYDMVYLFQRPESMARAMAKATRELRPGAWLVSLEFEASGWVANLCLQDDEDRPVWLYQVPFQVAEGACDASPLADQAASTSSAGAGRPNR
jgi:SAM-dependent methyltransferase